MKLVIRMTAPRGLLFLVSLAASAALVGEASAQACPAGCTSAKRACLQEGRSAKHACKLDCRENAPPEEQAGCRRDCRDVFAGAKAICASTRDDCRGTCAAQGNNAACPGACGQVLGQCMHDVAEAHHECIKSCEPGQGRGQCNQACGDTADTDRATCRADFDACTAACGGSPSRAFLDPPF